MLTGNLTSCIQFQNQQLLKENTLKQSNNAIFAYSVNDEEGKLNLPHLTNQTLGNVGNVSFKCAELTLRMRRWWNLSYIHVYTCTSTLYLW